VFGEDKGTQSAFTAEGSDHPDALSDGECGRRAAPEIFPDFNSEAVGNSIGLGTFVPPVSHFYPVAALVLLALMFWTIPSRRTLFRSIMIILLFCLR